LAYPVNAFWNMERRIARELLAIWAITTLKTIRRWKSSSSTNRLPRFRLVAAILVSICFERNRQRST
jgi:hypothetical protein